MLNLADLPDLDENDYKPLYVQLSDLLSEYIRSHELDPENPLLSEKHLMDRYGVSRSTVRLAMQRLEQAGLIQKIQGKGTFLSEKAAKRAGRGMFHDMDQYLAAQGISVATSLLGVTEDRPPLRWAEKMRLQPGESVRRIKRLKIVDGRPIGLEIRWLPARFIKQLGMDDFQESPIMALLNVSPETAVHQITYSVESGLLSEADAGSLDRPAGSPVIIRNGLYLNKKGVPVMFGRLTLLAEEFQFEYVFRKVDQVWAFENFGLNYESGGL